MLKLVRAWRVLFLLVGLPFWGPLPGWAGSFEVQVMTADLVVAAECLHRNENRVHLRVLEVIKGEAPATGTISLLLPVGSGRLPEVFTASSSLVFLTLSRSTESRDPPDFVLGTGTAAVVPLRRDREGRLVFPREPCVESWPRTDPTTYQGAVTLAGRLAQGREAQDLVLLSLARGTVRGDLLLPERDPQTQVTLPSLVESYAWFALAAIFSRPGVEHDLARVRARMTEEELAAGKAQAARYLRECAPGLEHILQRSDKIKVAAAFDAGELVDRDEVEAFAWYSLGRKSSYVPDIVASQEALARLTVRLGPDGVERGNLRTAALRAEIERRRKGGKP